MKLKFIYKSIFFIFIYFNNICHGVVIDKEKPVLVTGATGYVAGVLVNKLLEEGYTVHAAVRNKDDTEKLKYLNGIADKLDGTIKIFEADLMKEGSYDNAMEGCELVFHTASPFKLDVRNPQEELIDPAVKGTENVFSSVEKTSTVKRVVFTSSAAAVFGDNTETTAEENKEDQSSWKGLDESSWNETSSLTHNPYSFSKTQAEKKAIELSTDKRWELVSINPSFVIGPGINPNSTATSYQMITQLFDGTYKWKGVPKYGLATVDVRDVADAHFKAGFSEESKAQRYIVSAESTTLYDMSVVLHDKFGAEYPISNSSISKYFMLFLPPFLRGSLSRKFINKNINIGAHLNNQKSIDDLNIEYRSLEKSLIDFFEQITQSEEFKTKNPTLGKDTPSKSIIL